MRQVIDMSDELKKLQKAFDNEAPIKARQSAKNAAMFAAIAAFGQENSKLRQGNTIDNRLKEQGNTTGSKLLEILTLSKWRKSMKLSYALAGSASVAVLTLAVINTGQFQNIINPDLSNRADKEVSELAETTAGEPKTIVDGNAVLPSTNPAPSSSPTYMDNEKRPVVVLQDVSRPAGELRAASSVKKNERGLGGIVALGHSEADQMTAPRLRRQSIAKSKLDHTRAQGFYASSPEQPAPPHFQQQGRNKFEEVETNKLKLTQKEPVSTFSVDVDTASYSFMRASINRNVLPPKDAVRVEEMINYFPYAYQGPESRKVPFKAHVTVTPTPWNTHTKLVHIGIKGFDIAKNNKPHSNLVFLLDTSGSMNAPNKLPLLKSSFKLLLSTLEPEDTISIVAYAGSAGTVLEPTKAKDINKIFAALDRLRAGGSTAGGEGIRLAYQLAEANFDKKGINRVILATDGDFNVGIRDKRQLKGFIERKRKSGVFLSILGFGMGNYNDALMQTLAQNGNGNASYIDNLSEARKVLVQEASSTLFTIAKDVKIQMEFNPKTVSEYRLIGYETRKLKREDFNNDKVDAGDIGSGHTVTAIYEITPVNSQVKLIDPLRYKKRDGIASSEQQLEYGFLKMRYKLPNESKSKLIETPVRIAHARDDFSSAPQDVQFATAVAAYGQLLRGGKYTGSYSYDDVVKLALSAKGQDIYGYRAEFINLVRLAGSAAKIKAQGN